MKFSRFNWEYGKIRNHAPVAQWIERWPPEPNAAVRSRTGVQKKTV
jgi:hypothetical protein